MDKIRRFAPTKQIGLINLINHLYICEPTSTNDQKSLIIPLYWGVSRNLQHILFNQLQMNWKSCWYRVHKRKIRCLNSIFFQYNRYSVLCRRTTLLFLWFSFFDCEDLLITALIGRPPEPSERWTRWFQNFALVCSAADESRRLMIRHNHRSPNATSPVASFTSISNSFEWNELKDY